MPFFLDAHDQATGDKLADGPIISTARYRQTKKLSKSGTWGADLAASEARINHTAADPEDRVIDTKRVVHCHGVRGGGTSEFGAGVIDALGIETAEYGMDIGGNDLLSLLINPLVHGLELGTSGSPISVTDAVEAIMAYAGGTGLTIDTTTYGSTGSTTNANAVITDVINIGNFSVGDPIYGVGIPAGATIIGIDLVAEEITISANATVTNAGVSLDINQVVKTFAGETVLGALTTIAEMFNQDFRLNGDEVLWLYHVQEPAVDADDNPLYAVDSADPVAVLSNDSVVLIDSLSYQRDSSKIYNRGFFYGAGSGDARPTLTASNPFNLPAGYSYHTTTVGSKNYYAIEHDASVALHGAIERNVSFKDITAEMGIEALAAAGLSDLQRNADPLDTYRMTLQKVAVAIEPGQLLYTEVHRAVDGYRPLDINGNLLVLESTIDVGVDGTSTVGLLLANQRRHPETYTSRLKQVTKQVEAIGNYGQPTTSVNDSNVAKKDVANTFLADQTFDEAVIVSGSGWNDGHIRLGSYHLWVDSTGDLRIKSGSPSGDTDGVVVGTQA